MLAMRVATFASEISLVAHRVANEILLLAHMLQLRKLLKIEKIRFVLVMSYNKGCN
jgi:hypothetical protein